LIYKAKVAILIIQFKEITMIEVILYILQQFIYPLIEAFTISVVMAFMS